MTKGILCCFLALFLALQSQASFSGSLLDPTGRTLAGVPLTLSNTDTKQVFQTRTDDAGRFSFAAVPAGDYQVTISKPGFSDVAAHVILAPGQQVQREVVPRIAGLMHVYRVAPPGDRPESPSTPVPGRRVVLNAALPPDPCAKPSAAGCLTPPTRLVEMWPVFPRDRADRGASGNVEVSARLGTDGFLTDMRVNEGADPAFAAAALEALRAWEYSPLRLNGIPQEGRITVTFRFVAGTSW